MLTMKSSSHNKNIIIGDSGNSHYNRPAPIGATSSTQATSWFCIGGQWQQAATPQHSFQAGSGTKGSRLDLTGPLCKFRERQHVALCGPLDVKKTPAILRYATRVPDGL